MTKIELQPNGDYTAHIVGDGVHRIDVSVKCVGGFLGLFRTAIVMVYVDKEEDRDATAASIAESYRVFERNDSLAPDCNVYLTLLNPTNRKVNVDLELTRKMTTEEMKDELMSCRHLLRSPNVTATSGLL